jgi:hypothetical protein
MDTNTHEWSIKPFLEEKEIPLIMEKAQTEGWVMHSIDLQEGKIILKRPKKERLDG